MFFFSIPAKQYTQGMFIISGVNDIKEAHLSNMMNSHYLEYSDSASPSICIISLYDYIVSLYIEFFQRHDNRLARTQCSSYCCFVPYYTELQSFQTIGRANCKSGVSREAQDYRQDPVSSVVNAVRPGMSWCPLNSGAILDPKPHRCNITNS